MSPEIRQIKAGRRAIGITAAAFVALLCLSVVVVLWWRQSALAHEQAHAALQVESMSFANGKAIPEQYTCDSANDSPNLQWRNAPPATKGFALVMSDPDALIDFTHWLAYNIPPNVRELAEGASTHGAMPAGSAEGINSFGRPGYGGPCPPPGKPHHYVFRLYALDAQLDLPPGATRVQVESTMNQHVLAEGRIIGIYERRSE
jgi:hypothetical protein